jgi:F-type H+/Na+-transporting ATPase subunit alpha
LTEILKQGQFSPVPVEKQVLIIFAGVNGYLDDLQVEDIKKFEAELYKYADSAHPGVLTSIREKKELNDDIKGQVKSLLEEFKKKFTATIAAAKA